MGTCMFVLLFFICCSQSYIYEISYFTEFREIYILNKEIFYLFQTKINIYKGKLTERLAYM